jgi:hypothetical protein
MSKDRTRISDANNMPDGGAEKAKQLPPKSGLYHTIISAGNIAGATGKINYQKAQNEQVINNMGAWIVLGSDRPNSVRSGFGASGATRAASIDLVVGRLATARKGQGPRQPAWVNNDFSADAARVFIGQMTNVDHNFGLAPGHSPQSKARSAVGVKADAVRIIGRESIRLITGGSDGVKHQPGGEPTSLGKKIQQPAPSIELISGNAVNDRVIWGGIFNPKERIRGLQGVALGYNTRDGIRELVDLVEQIGAATMAIGAVAEKMFIAIGIDSPLTLGGISAISVIESMLRGKASLYHLRAEMATYRMNYLSPSGPKCIWSRNVKVT